jgi:tRNA dimethylallyltransferase
MANKPLIAIVGATASGKSGLALEIAKQFKGEIISADSRTIYKGMDIGTAKPTMSERAGITHHLIDVIDPSEVFSAADFQRLANEAMTEIREDGKFPIIVGGTGLYVDALLYDFEFRPVDASRREQLNQLSVAELQQIIDDENLPMPENTQNPRHLVRTIEAGGAGITRKPLLKGVLIVGLAINPELLRARIAGRVHEMFAQGLVAEVKKVVDTYGWDAPGMQAIGYKEFEDYFTGKADLETVKQQIIRNTQAYAKRQRTWFKRNPDIQWYDSQEQALQAIAQFLQISE